MSRTTFTSLRLRAASAVAAMHAPCELIRYNRAQARKKFNVEPNMLRMAMYIDEVECRYFRRHVASFSSSPRSYIRSACEVSACTENADMSAECVLYMHEGKWPGPVYVLQLNSLPFACYRFFPCSRVFVNRLPFRW